MIFKRAVIVLILGVFLVSPLTWVAAQSADTATDTSDAEAEQRAAEAEARAREAAAAKEAEEAAIRAKIEAQNKQIEALDKEISKYEQQLTTVGKEKQTLQSAVRELDVSRSKVSTQIQATTKRIDVIEMEIEDLGDSIEVHQEAIDRNQAALGQMLRSLDTVETTGMFEAMLASGSISQYWDDIEQIDALQTAVYSRIADIADNKEKLEANKSASESKRGDLTKQQKNLTSQKYSLDINRTEKNKLLAQTKNKESEYQAMLEEKRKAKIEFEKALSEYESKLKYTLDTNKVAPAGKGVLRWPLDSVRITQYFGNTEFARSGAYNGSGHNGIDLAASVGTPLKAALTGTVQATGNTDEYKGCYSYGKWVLIRHPNGISTLYAHLSKISVTKGESVETGDLIGYTGNTGYSTGPHLHLSVFASEPVQVVRMGDVKKITSCAGAYVPVAPLQAYLNPMDYL